MPFPGLGLSCAPRRACRCFEPHLAEPWIRALMPCLQALGTVLVQAIGLWRVFREGEEAEPGKHGWEEGGRQEEGRRKACPGWGILGVPAGRGRGWACICHFLAVEAGAKRLTPLLILKLEIMRVHFLSAGRGLSMSDPRSSSHPVQ